ncbi:MAG: ATP-binding protein [Victivallales bacterium]|jgi:hypothetical protein|nr:ATP-binding protein [Victivallales bacterium]
MEKLPGKLSNDFAELVYRGVESDVLDYKAALCWTRMTRQAKGKIVRHCLALANTKGGCIVIGVGEDSSGHPSIYTGLDREQIHSFDPTTVGQFVNRYVEPPIELTVERPLVDGKRYAIFMIRAFRTLPHVCTNGIEGELQTGVFYIRTPDASSRPAYRAIEMQMLIQRALRNQREELGRMLRGILYESRLSTESESSEEFKSALANSTVFFKRRKSPPANTPALLINLTVTPPRFHSEAFSLSALRRAVDAALPALPTPEFLDSDELKNAYVTNTSLRALSQKRMRMWQVFKSGMFHYIAYVPVPGHELDFMLLVQKIAEAFHFLGKLYAELGFAEELLTISLTFENTEDVRLVLPHKQRAKFFCRIPKIAIDMNRSAADLASDAAAHATRMTGEIAERFNVSDQYLTNLSEMIGDYLEQR